ncbi:hypothetical protein CHS0354_014933 [Potamilus streckersoni]|uniref:RING-type domain-containing protein n=1 Tax=Potamilus streckersoni TaxID=2493646 RepID=A0AAE0S8B6_9BIVA|nr:hypothetical protein CHS0354_014933 [Potamilus streckersoni]
MNSNSNAPLNPSVAGMLRPPTFFWQDEDGNLINLQERLNFNPRIPSQVSQVIYGVLPGHGHVYIHQNPYLQHLSNSQGQSTLGHSHFHSNDMPGSGYSLANQEVSTVLDIDMDPEGGGQGHDMSSRYTHAYNFQGGYSGNQNGGGDTPSHGHTHDSEEGNRMSRMKIFFSSGIFILILFIRIMADHILGLLVFIGLSAGFYYANVRMVQIVHQLSLKEMTRRGQVVSSCLWQILFLSSHIACIYYFFSDQELWRVLIFELPVKWEGDLFALFWVTMVTDYVLKFIAIILKALLSTVPSCLFPQKKRGKYYMFLEVLVQFFRCILPIMPWVYYLNDNQKSGRGILAFILCIIYLIAKAVTVFLKFRELANAFLKLAVDAAYGHKPTTADIASRGENCAICQEDYKDPVMLSCKHIFCENCVSVWFDREKTCPMCRAEIYTDDPKWRDGSTSSSIQWY